MGAGLEVRVLGGVEAHRDGVPVTLGGPKPRLLLAMLLASRGAVVSTDRLCDELWGDDQPADPGAVLQSHLSRLRRVLRPEAEIVARPPGYLIEIAAERVDASRFEARCRDARAAAPADAAAALDDALECFRGAAFEEFADRDWARNEAIRLDELRLNAREDRIDARLASGDHVAVVPELEALVDEHPFRERPWQQLVLALYRSGRAADALRRLASLRALMRDDLGLDLSPALRELETQVLTDDPALLLATPDPVRSVPRRPPAPTTLLVGRDADSSRLAGLLRAHRLVTLTGPGGVGKTRLAQRVANEHWDELQGEVFVVALAPVHDPSSTVAAIATAVDVQQRQHLSVEDSLFEYLRGRRALLVLDNCEHLRAPIASLVERLLARCPDVTVLTTSREVLGLPAEQVWRVEPLAVAPVGDPVELVRDAPAVRLFVERAAASRDGFTLTEENAGAVADIVRRVDGLPLAIELAAARIRVMSPAALATRLESRLDLLEGAQTSLIERHRTLGDLVAWSHALLDPDEQELFTRLSVFAGGFELDAVETVCAEDGHRPGEVARLLANLVDKSMVQVVDPDVPRYRLLEPLREFGRARLDPPDHLAVSGRHAAFYLGLAERSAVALTGPDEAAAVTALDRDFDNLRAAHRWSLDHAEIDVAIRLVVALREYSFRTMRAEVIQWADDVLALDGAYEHPRAALALAVAAYGRFVRGDLEASIASGRRAMALAESTGSDTSGLAERALANALFYRGEIRDATDLMERMIASAEHGTAARLAHALYIRSVSYASLGDQVRGAQYAGESLAAARTSGSPTARAQAAYALGLSIEGTDPVEADAHLRQAADLAQGAGNRWIQAFALTEVLSLQARQGQPERALARYADVIDLWYRGGDWANQWLSLRHVFGILVQLRDHHGAATLHGALSAAGAAYALPIEASDAERIAQLVDTLRQELGAADFAATVRRGASMSDGELIDFARARIRALAVLDAAPA